MGKARDHASETERPLAEDAVSRLLRRLRPFLPLALLLAAGAAIVLGGWHRYLSLETFLAQRAALAETVEAHRLTAMLAMGGLYAGAVALSLPVGLALSLAAGFLFGPVSGGVLVAISATLGATILFLVARSSIGEALAAKAGPKLQTLAAGFREDAFNYLLFLRLVPVAPFWLVNLAPALLGVPTLTYVAATAIGILPATFTFTTLGSGLDSVIAAQQAANAGCEGSDCQVALDVGALVTPTLLAGFAALGLLALVPVAVKRWRRRGGGR